MSVTDRDALMALFIIVVFPVLLFFLLKHLRSGKKQKLTVTLSKSSVYFPDYLIMTIVNNMTKAVDLDNPLLVFSNFLIKRKLKITGINGYRFYPLWLDPGEKHELKIDLRPFHQYDKSLKKYPKVTLHIRDVNGKITASHHVMLRKTLFS
jgi:hypothetical protein